MKPSLNIYPPRPLKEEGHIIRALIKQIEFSPAFRKLVNDKDNKPITNRDGTTVLYAALMGIYYQQVCRQVQSKGQISQGEWVRLNRMAEGHFDLIENDVHVVPDKESKA